MEEICRPTFLTWVGTGALLSKNEVFSMNMVHFVNFLHRFEHYRKCIYAHI